MILRQETQLAASGSSEGSLNRYMDGTNRYKISSHNQGIVMHQTTRIRTPVHQAMKRERVHQTYYDSSFDPINPYSTRPVPELTPVHEAYELSSSQEPVTDSLRRVPLFHDKGSVNPHGRHCES